MPSRNLPTLATIAKAAKLSKAAVSMAMRNDPSIPEHTCKRVQEIARQLNYRPNPMIAALNATVGSNRSKGATLAYICHQRELMTMGQEDMVRRFYEGVKTQADQLGYGLDLFFASDYTGKEKRLHEVLLSRGIHGLIVSPRDCDGPEDWMEWGDFAVVGLGYQFSDMDRVAPNNFVNIRKMLIYAAAKGYRRIGFASGRIEDEVNSRHMTGAYLEFQYEQKDIEALPILQYQCFSSKKASKWLKQYRPDCVIVSDTNFLEWVEQSGIQIPDQLEILSCCRRMLPEYTHLKFRSRQIGSDAVNLVSQKLILNERGIPETPRLMLVTGTLVEGKSVQSSATESVQ